MNDGFNIGTLLMFVGGAILLAFFCSIGLIARIREQRIEARKTLAAKARAGSNTADVTHQLADPERHDHRDGAPEQNAENGP